MDDRLSIRITVDGRTYPMNVNRSEEEKIRAAAKLINERLNVYKGRYNTSGKDSYDFLVMVAIDLVTKYMDKENKTDNNDLVSELRIITSEVDDYIKKIQAL
jgi:cell division protein ZapA